MRNMLGLMIVAALVATGAAQTVTFDLSLTGGSTVAPGGDVDWQITATLDSGLGLALVGVDLVQDAGNPATFDIPYADSAPAAMTNFARPAGITNPPEGSSTGYEGSQRGTAGAMNLIQIGGAQNSFGEAMAGGTGVAENATVVGNVGIGGQVIATGTIVAPATEGDYTISLAAGFANVFTAINTPPAYSPVAAATAAYGTQSVMFTVGGSTYEIGDVNCDGAVNFGDIDPFVLAITDAVGYAAAYPDCDRDLADINDDAAVNFGDIDPFVALITGG